ncbi:tripartite tricarboxylate transporter substrate-binding protein [Methylocella sp. CPCC 101449]|uniref:tripartite tricarboxylate transporter substrate-binding protein n=1 Tax=Methylocella sp. CPCC 101449 TaxID=2987531 RepID=UPI00288E5F35|nr:tripartite tricarboxylate transporter substrate-binding protein [Methylocella sp. CPCC 101449]MDT2024216.1 tripartite tricarboxylate transporter substrate-binding protein [Methylocella sp. CPCC 101449]
MIAKIMSSAKIARATTVAVAAFLLAAAPAAAQDEAAFYKGKIIKFVVGVGVGGGFDTYARMIAPYLARELGANVVVENQVGAGGIVALNRIANSPPDGLQLHIANGTPAALGQIVDNQNARYDLTKLEHLGIVSAYPWIWLVAKDSPFKAPADVLKPGARVRWGGTGLNDGPGDGAAITCEALRLNCQIILGYKGSAEIALAMERGEQDALYVSDSSAAQIDKSGQARAFLSMGRKRSELLPNVPTVFESFKLDDDQIWWLDFRNSINDLGRILVTTQGVPPARLAVLRAAVKRALTDPALIAEGEKSQRYIAFQEPEVARDLAVKALGTVTAEQRERIRKVVMKGQ